MSPPTDSMEIEESTLSPGSGATTQIWLPESIKVSLSVFLSNSLGRMSMLLIPSTRTVASKAVNELGVSGSFEFTDFLDASLPTLNSLENLAELTMNVCFILDSDDDSAAVEELGSGLMLAVGR